jgi:ligand-binding SRPBCC domain-containing protein
VSAAAVPPAAAPLRLLRGVRVLRSALWVPATPAELWPFFSSADNLPLLTPPWLRFTIANAPAVLAVGAHIDYRLRVRGVPLRWRSRIARWEPGRCFADEQERGPYRLWLHTHTFEPLDGGTVLGDRVEFAVRGGPFAPWIGRWLVEPDLLRIFRYRMVRIAERFGGDAAAGRVAIGPAGAFTS